ncbi:pali-domain-containing protein [Amanita rubescens]|nr:pali-domain-containing protein [Amanita rubescens]
MPVGQAIPGAFLCLSAAVLLVFASVSSPTWEKISFLDVSSRSRTTHFGVFGYTGSKASIGYHFNVPRNFDSSQLESTVIYNLTKTLILHPIAAGLAGIAFLFGLCGMAHQRSGTVFMTLVTGLAAITTLVAWIIDMSLFGVARTQFRNQGYSAQYGNANWLTLGALIALLLGFVASTVGIFGRYKRRDHNY